MKPDYQIKNVKLYCCDNMEFMKQIPDNYYNLAVVDPPYGIGMDNSNKRTKPDRPNSYTDYPDFRYHKTNWDANSPNKMFFDELFRISINQIVWGANYLCEFLPPGKGWIFWNKLNGLNNCFSDGEFAFSSKGVQSKYFECSQFVNLKGGKSRIHPTQKPTELYKWILANYAKEGDKIFDSHGGSFSSACACLDMGFDFDGCEIDQEYFDNAVNRLKNNVQEYLDFT
jgi:site-specific DNA-methyltransferase (adenine-specific)